MEDFVVLSILDVQVDKRKYDKRQVQCYVMLGGECVDNLILGSHSAQVQGSEAGLMGIDGSDQEERGSEDGFQQNNKQQTGAKRTKIPLYG